MNLTPDECIKLQAIADWLNDESTRTIRSDKAERLFVYARFLTEMLTKSQSINPKG